jgi:hypothetical protein
VLSDRLANAIIVVVTIVWAANLGAGIFVHGYQPLESVNAVFMAVVGGAFALKQRSKDDKPGGDGE